MRKKWVSLALLLIITGSLCITSCAKRVVISEPEYVSIEEKVIN